MDTKNLPSRIRKSTFGIILIAVLFTSLCSVTIPAVSAQEANVKTEKELLPIPPSPSTEELAKMLEADLSTYGSEIPDGAFLVVNHFDVYEEWMMIAYFFDDQYGGWKAGELGIGTVSANEWVVISFANPAYNEWLDRLPSQLINPEAKNFFVVPYPSEVTSLSAYTGHRLPWQGGVSHTVTKGVGNHSHPYEYWAYDFAMSRNTELWASYSGVVVHVTQGYGPGACDPNLSNSGNRVVVNNDDGSASLYLHLEQNGARVSVGQRIKRGDLVALSGNSGYVCSSTGGDGAHLHFQVQTQGSSWWTQSQQVIFDPNGEPSAGSSPVSGNYRDSVGIVGGRVLNTSGQAVSGATVYAQSGGTSATTNTSGYYALQNVPGGSTQIIGSHPTYGNGILNVNVVANQSQQVADLWLGYVCIAADSNCDPIPNGTDNAAFVTDVTIPDGTTMNPGQSFTKTWRMKNTGNTTWGSGYSWVFTSGSQLGAPSSVSVPSTSPNNTADLSVNMTAPGSGGSYTGYWRMKNPQGQFFGDSVWVRITVNSPPPSGNWQAKYAEGDSCWWDTNCGQFNGTAVPKCEENISGAELHKNWGTAAPCGGMNGDNWVGNFVSTINFPSGNYVFHVNHDDGAKFWLNGNSREFGGSGTDIICNGSSGFSLSGNQSLRIMLREQGGDARIDVTWSNDTSVCNPPGDFSKSNPANFINWQPTSVTLSWDPSDRAASYEYCYDTTNNNSCDGSWIGTGTNRSKTISGLSQGTTYYWQVRARNSGGTKESNYGSWWSFTTQSSQPLPDILYNGGFENGYTVEPWAYPYGWSKNAWNMDYSTFTWDTAQKHSGNRSIKISNNVSNDARWTATVWVQSNADYRLSGWVKTANIAQNGDRGANLSILDTWISTNKLYGTNNWTFVSVDFNTGSREYIQVAARVGMYSGTITGTAWFDDLKLELLSPPKCYTVTTNSIPTSGGNVSVMTPPNCNNGIQYVHGTIVTFTATPNSGQTFAHWYGANPTFETPATAFIVENKNVTAYFSNGSDTTGVFRPSNGLLYLKNRNTTGFADVAINYGLGGDYPVTGDWDGDGDNTIGIYRNGVFYLRNYNTIGFANLVFAFGAPGDQPVAGDWNGDGVDTIGVYRSSTGTFFLRNSNSAGAPEMLFSLGVPGDVGIAGDWNGNGVDTTGVFRPSNGALYLKNTNATGFADVQINYGLPGDKPVTGDWNNDGIDTIGVYRNGVFYLRNLNTIGFADIVFALGVPGDMPIAGNWDGLP